MILAEVLHAKIPAAQNQHNVGVRTKALSQAQGGGKSARSSGLGEDLGTFQ